MYMQGGQRVGQGGSWEVDPGRTVTLRRPARELTRGRASAQTCGGVWAPRPTDYVYVRIVGAAYMPPAGSRGQLSAGGS